MKYPYYYGIPDEELEANKRAEKPRKLVLLPDHRFFYLGHGICDDSGPCMQVVREYQFANWHRLRNQQDRSTSRANQLRGLRL